MKLLLIGAGSVGVYFCGRAALGGAEVEVAAHSQADKIREEGYTVESIYGDFSFRPSSVLSSVQDVSPDIDAIVLSTKVLPDIDRCKLLAPAVNLPHHPPVILIQNGIGIEDEIAGAFPGNLLISAVAYIGASRKSVNHIIHSGAGRLLMGRFGGGDVKEVEKLADVFRQGGVSCDVVEDIALERWRKLLWNLPFNPVSVLAGGINSRELCDRGEIEGLCAVLMKEVIAVANACGVPLTEQMADEQFAYTRDFPPYRTSMLQDFEQHRQLEVDAVIGNAVKLADRLNIPVPAMRCCAALLRSVDRKNRE